MNKINKGYIQKVEDNIFILRDDLLPFSFGGNKYRIAMEYIKDMKKKKKDCIICYGSSTSNLNRVISAICNSENIPCYLIIKKDNKNYHSFNEQLSVNSKAYIFYSDENVSKTVQKVMNICIKKGYNPYYVYGDIYGKGNELASIHCYKNVYKNVIKKSDFDYIFVPVGTGSTISSLIVNIIKNNGKEKIVGISISRRKDVIESVIENVLEKLNLDSNDYLIVDDYLFGGYGKFNKKIEKTIFDIYSMYGIPLDPVYTGKAFYGMKVFIKKNNITDKVLFIHTGGGSFVL